MDLLLKNEYSCAHLAVLGGHLPLLQHMYDMGVDVDAATEDGWTPLHLAVQHSKEQVKPVQT